jgi:hypothetical protein
MAENSKNASDDKQGTAANQGTPALVPGATEVRTSDPIVATPVSGPPPDRAVAFQTAGLSSAATDYPFPASAGVVQCDDNSAVQPDRQKSGSANGRGEKHQAKQEGHGHDRGGEERHRHGHHKRQDPARKAKQKLERAGHKMPAWPTLLIICLLSIVCGAVGAWGYSALFGSSQSDAPDKSSDKGGKKSDKGGGSAKSGGDNSAGSDSESTSAIKDLKTNLEDLDDGITQLTARLDRLTESIQESRLPTPEFYEGSSRIAKMASANSEAPPILPNALPTQLNVLQRKVQQMADLPARVQALEELLLTLQEEIKTAHAPRLER